MSESHRGRFTGWHVTAIFVVFFAAVTMVNLFMAFKASATFGGVVVENSYVASQHFNRWLDLSAADESLGWRAGAARVADGRLAVSVYGPPAGPRSLTGVARHPLGREADRPLSFARLPDGRFISRQRLPSGRWRLRLEVSAAGRKWRTEGDLR